MAFTETGIMMFVLGIIFLLAGLAILTVGIKMSGKKSGKWPITIAGAAFALIMLVGVLLPLGGMMDTGYSAGWFTTTPTTPGGGTATDPAGEYYTGTLTYVWALVENEITQATAEADTDSNWYIMNEADTKASGFDFFSNDVVGTYSDQYSASADTGAAEAHAIRVKNVEPGAKLVAIYKNASGVLTAGTSYYNKIIPFTPEPELLSESSYKPDRKVMADPNPWGLAIAGDASWTFAPATADFNSTSTKTLYINIGVATDGRQLGAGEPYAKMRLYLLSVTATDTNVTATHRTSEGGLTSSPLGNVKEYPLNAGWKMDNEADLRYVDIPTLRYSDARGINETITVQVKYTNVGADEAKCTAKTNIWDFGIRLYTSTDTDLREDVFTAEATTTTDTDGVGWTQQHTVTHA